MNCPHCQNANPNGAKFCLNCGKALAQRCVNCQAELVAGARFCANCGHPVAQGESPRATRPAPTMVGERRVVTSLFADVVGSTALTEQLDPEDWTIIINGAFDLMTSAIHRYEGTIARLMGDAVLAFFGAPVAHEDDPARAMRAALDLIGAAHEYAAEVRREYGIEFAVRAGVSTGPVVVGDVGSTLAFEYTAMGDSVNLAARLQSAARPMTLLISEQTYRFVSPLFECVDLGDLEIKGKAEPVRVYEVQGPKAEPGRVRGLSGLASPLVGRDLELEKLRRSSAEAQSGVGRIAALVGEPGLGKSRLVSEWRRGAGPSLQWAEGRCLTYGQGLAYHLLLDLLHSLLGLSGAASEPARREALQGRTAELFGAAAVEVYPYLGHLLSLQLEAEALDRVRRLDPQELQGYYLAALRRLLGAMATQRPLALVLEDIHWADPSSTELLINVLPLIHEVPLFFCLVTRSDRDAPGWKLVAQAREVGGASFTEVMLTPLPEVASRQLVSNLLEVEALPEAIRDLILRKAEGNPLFVEEVIRTLIERGAIVQEGAHWAAGKDLAEVEIPDNLHGLLLARIDSLPDDVKRTLRAAAVIGRQFPINVLQQVLDA